MNDEMLRCNVCQYTWLPNKKMLTPGRDKPVMCPACQSRKWQEPKPTT